MSVKKLVFKGQSFLSRSFILNYMGACPVYSGSCRVVSEPIFLAQETIHNEDGLSKAREHYALGNQFFGRGKFIEARQEFQTAYDLSEKPRLLFNIAQCHKNLGEYKEAIDFFERYLKALPDADNKAEVEGDIEALRKKMELGEVELPPLVALPPRVDSDDEGPSSTDGDVVLSPKPATTTDAPPVVPIPIEESVNSSGAYRKWMWGSAALAGLSLVVAGEGFYMARKRNDAYDERIGNLKGEGRLVMDAGRWHYVDQQAAADNRLSLAGLKEEGQRFEKIGYTAAIGSGALLGLAVLFKVIGEEGPSEQAGHQDPPVSMGVASGKFYLSWERHF